MCGKWMACEMAKGHELYSAYTLLQMQQGFKSNKRTYRTIFNDAAKTFYSTDTKAVEMSHLKDSAGTTKDQFKTYSNWNTKILLCSRKISLISSAS